jgi:integrase
MARRGWHEGTVYKRADGRWEAKIDIGRGLDGKRRRKSIFGATQADVIRKLRKLGGRAADGQLLATTTPTVKNFLEEWFKTHQDDWRPSTQRAYRGAIDRYLVPAFGALRVEQLTPRHVQTWLTDHKTEHGARRRITLAHAALRSALSHAQRLQLVTINAAELVTVPTPKKKPIRPLTTDEARAFLTVAATHRLGAFFSVALACGLRLGEAMGVKWDNVNLDTGHVQVRQQLQRVGKRLELQELKTERSRRTLVLPMVCVKALRAHRKRQQEERLKAGDKWTDTGLVFVTGTKAKKPGKGARERAGLPLDPRNVTRVFTGLLEDAKVRHVRFHDLRHSAASLLIASGVELVEVSMLLGHAELRTTSDIYGHLVEQTATKAAQRMDAVLG